MSIVANVLLDWKIFLVCFGLLVSISLINAKLPILPVSCLTFVTTSVVLWFTSMCVTFVCLNKLLQKTEPLELLVGPKPNKQAPKSLKPEVSRVTTLTADIDKYFISYWYKWISDDEDFTNESKAFTEEVITRLAEVQSSVSNKVLLKGVLNVYLKHFKEYRRSVKRKNKYDGAIEDLYRYSHLSNNNSKSKDFFVHRLTKNLLQHFINSELWNSLPCHILVSILARKFSSYILNHYSDPEVLNYTLLYLLASKEVRDKYDLLTYSRISLCQYQDVNVVGDKPEEKAVQQVDQVIVGEIVDAAIKDVHVVEDNVDVELVEVHSDIKSQPAKKVKHRKRASGRKVDVAEELKEESATDKRITSNPVTIYEPKGHRTINTWTDPKDLTMGISLGQDPLDAMPVEGVKSFGKGMFWETGKMEYSEDSPAHAANLLLNEMKQTTQNTMEGLKSSIKPISDATVNTLHNIKDLQESTMNNALNRIGDFQESNPSKPENREKKELQIPFISMEKPEMGTDSPDPEYEETADLASSIAKLRSLLQQRSSESSLSTPALSPMPTDDVAPKPAEIDNTSDIEEVDGVMPSFYKFCAKTATGVLDKTLSTIKTALPGNPQDVGQSDNPWIFIQVDQNEANIVTRMKKLLTERKEYCTLDTEIDTAYEAIDSLNTLQPSLSAMTFEDELDAFEVKLPITKALVDIFCELLADTDSPFVREPMIRAILLSLGTTFENFVVTRVDKFMENLCVNLVMIPENTNTNTLMLEVDAYVEAILNSLPDVVKLVFDKSTLFKAFTTLVSSLQIQKINQDVILQIFELLVMKLIEESYQLSPPASA